MATLLTPSFSEIPEGDPIPAEILAYFQQKLRNALHQLVLREWIKRQHDGVSRKDLARRIGKKPEQITRWLGTPSNWTLDTLSDLLTGMGIEPQINTEPIVKPSTTEPVVRITVSHGDLKAGNVLFAALPFNSDPAPPQRPFSAYWPQGLTGSFPAHFLTDRAPTDDDFDAVPDDGEPSVVVQ